MQINLRRELTLFDIMSYEKMKIELKDLNVLIIGAGTMGRGIAEVFSTKGINTTLYDAFPEQLDKAKALIRSDMNYLKDEGIINAQEVHNTETHITYEADLQKCASIADVVIESVFEDANAKRDVFMKLDKLCTPECLFCSNTSGANIFEIAKVSHPERLVITHFFNPAYVMPLVEIVIDTVTSQKTQTIIKELLEYVGKKPSVINQYIPGFIVNRIASAIVREASYMITQGWTTGEDIDCAIRNTSGLRYAFEGPLALYDVVGWDLTTSISEEIQKSLCNDICKNQLGTEMIRKGELGIKSGKGIFDYSGIDIPAYMNERAHKIIKMTKVYF